MYTMHLYPFIMAFPGGLEGKESACNAGDLGLIPGLGRSFREGNGYPLQYSCLENSKDRRAWRAIDFCTDMSVTTTLGKYQEHNCWVIW